MAEPHIYISQSMMKDLSVVAEAMKLEREPGVVTIEGKINMSAVFQRLIIRYREELKNRPSPVEDKSMWEFLQEASNIKERV